jgi:hypothetical protein
VSTANAEIHRVHRQRAALLALALLRAVVATANLAALRSTVEKVSHRCIIKRPVLRPADADDDSGSK